MFLMSHIKSNSILVLDMDSPLNGMVLHEHSLNDIFLLWGQYDLQKYIKTPNFCELQVYLFFLLNIS